MLIVFFKSINQYINLFVLFLASLLLSACNGDGWFGTKQLGLMGIETLGQSVATDTNGNVYVAGYTNGGLDGNTKNGIWEFFITKYNNNGNKQYTKQLGVPGTETLGYSTTTDPSGNVYVAGYTTGGLDGNTLTGTHDFFLTKYDSTGNKQYTKQLGVSGADTRGNSVATDANSNVYVAGITSGNLDGNTLTGTQDFFVTKYDSNGNKKFTRLLGVTGADTRGRSVITDLNGNFYVAGYTFGGLDGNPLTGVGSTDLFVTKYDSNGNKQFTRLLGVTGAFTYGQSVTTDDSGNVYVAGSTFGGLDGNTKTGVWDFFVTKYNSLGIKQFTRQVGVVGSFTIGNSVTTDAIGNVYVTGYTNGGLDDNTLTGTNDFFVTKYDSTGVRQFTKQLGVSGADTKGVAAATDANGNVFVAGYTNGGLDGNILNGTHDFFVTKYDSSGVKQ